MKRIVSLSTFILKRFGNYLSFRFDLNLAETFYDRLPNEQFALLFNVVEFQNGMPEIFKLSTSFILVGEYSDSSSYVKWFEFNSIEDSNQSFLLEEDEFIDILFDMHDDTDIFNIDFYYQTYGLSRNAQIINEHKDYLKWLSKKHSFIINETDLELDKCGFVTVDDRNLFRQIVDIKYRDSFSGNEKALRMLDKMIDSNPINTLALFFRGVVRIDYFKANRFQAQLFKYDIGAIEAEEAVIFDLSNYDFNRAIQLNAYFKLIHLRLVVLKRIIKSDRHYNYQYYPFFDFKL
jgi:hypothetical protein